MTTRQKRRRVNAGLLAREIDSVDGLLVTSDRCIEQSVYQPPVLTYHNDEVYLSNEGPHDIVSDSDISPESESDDEYYDCVCDETFYDCEEPNGEETLSGQEIESCETNDFKNLLAAWVVECQIKQVHVDKLLLLLKSFAGVYNIFLNLPNTCRTLVNTIRQTFLKEIGSGHYYHFGIENGVKMTLRRLGIKCLGTSRKIRLIVNIDGIPISKSSGSQFWPILGRIVGINQNSKPFVIGIYHGHSKPIDANIFLSDFTTEMQILCQTGISFNGKTVEIELFGFVCDAPARSYITFTKSHSGYASCSKCIDEGEWDGRIVFLNENSTLRDDRSFRDKLHEDHHTGTSILESLPIDMVAAFPLDYMHLVCLGVMRKLLWSWIRGSPRCRLAAFQRDEISRYLIYISAFIPCEFSRKSRSLNELPRWKATELRLFLFYTGPVILKRFLPNFLYNHFLLLHVAVKILSTKSLCQKENIDYAKMLLVLFVTQCKEYYGEKFLSYNVHNLIHLADDVRKFGPLDAFSAFPFENHLQSLKHLLRKHDKPLPQVIRRILEIEQNSLPVPNQENDGRTILKRMHSNGPVINSCKGKQFKNLQFKNWTFKCDNKADCYVILKGFAVVQVKNFVQNEAGIFLVGKQFTRKKKLFNSPLDSSRLEIFSVECLSPLGFWPISSIEYKGILIPTKIESENEFAVFPLKMDSHVE